MANQPEPETETTEQPRRRPAPRPNQLQQYLERVPPRYRNKRWLIGGPVAVLLLLVFGGDCLCKAARSSSALRSQWPRWWRWRLPPPRRSRSSLADRPTPLPSQYAFTHFVNEMADCYQQQGLPSSLESVEADIMVDVPVAVNALMKLYADNLCREEDPVAPDHAAAWAGCSGPPTCPCPTCPRPSHRNRANSRAGATRRAALRPFNERNHRFDTPRRPSGAILRSN